MQRFGHTQWGLSEMSDGPYVFHADAHAALATRDARIAELEKDRDRLDWMQKMNSEVFWINAKLCEVTLGLTVGSGEAEDLRSAIDAAIAAAKGE